MIKTFFKKMLLTLSATVIIAAGCGISAEPVHAATVGLNVASHSKEEIVQYIVNNNVKLNDPITYDVEPVFTAPYVNGRLSDETMDSAIKMLNNARYVAGLQSVTHNSAWDEMMMAATLVNKANNVLTHTPNQPAGMSDSLYQLGYSGCSSANIGMGHSTLNQDIIQGWLADSGNNNLATMGHRRWCLNPTMGATSFGVAGTAYPRYYAMYAFDRSNRTATESRVAWPAQVMPLQYFGNNYPWTISMGSSVTMANINVTLTRRSDNQTWRFSSASADGYFNVNNGGYGQTGCITFRPDSISYADGDVFDVTITGMADTVQYNVNFFDLDKDFHTHEYSTSGIGINQVNPGMNITYVCQCGDKYTKFFPSTLVSVTTPATCTSPGKGGYDCPTDSGTYSYTSTIPALGHAWDGGVVTTAATCTSDGVKTSHCTRCDASTTEPIKASGHKSVSVGAVAATCEKGGTTAGTKCSVCGQVLSGCTTTNALGHAWNSGVVTTAATCTNDGVKTFTCTRCNGTRTEAIKATGHKSVSVGAVAATCEKDGTTAGTKCSVCNQILSGCTTIKALGHDWDEGVVTTEPTYDTEGVKTFSCSRCDATRTETIPCLKKDDRDFITRLAGAGRVDTSLQAADEYKDLMGMDKFDTVILANAYNFPDALGGSYLAAVKEAPMLLVDGGDIMLTANYVINNSNGGATVYILGGPAAVPSSIESALASEGMNVIRLAGNTRYETNIKVLDEAGVDGQDTLLVVNGNNYADSLAASSTGAPILMVDGPASALMTEQRDWLPNHEFDEFVVLGGQGAVSSAIADELTNSYAAGDANRVFRLAGGTRCETSTLVADYFFGDAHEVTFAYAWDFPDGLSGGPVANAVHAPVILVADSPDDLNVVGQYIRSKTLDHVYVMGGTARLSDAVITGLVG